MKRWLSGLLISSFLTVTVYTLAEPIPTEVWAKEDVLDVEISRNASHISILRAGDGGNSSATIEVYKVGEGGVNSLELLRRVDSEPMEITGYAWLSDKIFIMTLVQQVRDKIDGFNQGVYEYKFALVDVESGEMNAFDARETGLTHLLPKEPNKVIISTLEKDRRVPQYYELDLETGDKRLVLRGNMGRRSVVFNADGEPKFSFGLDRTTKESVNYYRPTKESGWTEIHRQHLDAFDSFAVLGMDHEYPGNAFVLAHNGRDKAAVWSFNLETKEYGELLYARNDRDVAGAVYHSNRWTNPDEIVGFSTLKKDREIVFLNGEEEALYGSLKELIPAAHSLSVTSRSEEGDSMIVYNSGPREPPTYYWYHKGKFKVIGSNYPELPTKDLADVDLINYKTRDGMTIPAYVTVPQGEGPFPLVVLPHGGPFVREYISFDLWSQMLANHGYLVIQPQYRGSRGLGLQHYKSAFEDGGEAGFAMQDDLDDGALALVKKGLADKDRIAMFGWSYGGYTSLVAAMRNPQIYQCTMAGAAVSDPIMQVNYYRDDTFGAQRAEQLTTWGDAFSPIREIEKINVPMLVIHGELDQRVPVDHSRKLAKRIRDNEHLFKYVEIEGIDHFSNTMKRDHREQLYAEMIGFLQNDCGPDGL